MTISTIQQALASQRWETARRLALAALTTTKQPYEIRLLLHTACRRLGDYSAARECLESISPATDDPKLTE